MSILLYGPEQVNILSTIVPTNDYLLLGPASNAFDLRSSYPEIYQEVNSNWIVQGGNGLVLWLPVRQQRLSMDGCLSMTPLMPLRLPTLHQLTLASVTLP